MTPALSAPAQAWRVECIVWHSQPSVAYCFLIMVWSLSGVGLLSAAVVVLLASDVSCPPPTIVKPPSPPFHPETWHLYLLAGYASHTPTNLYARFLHLCSSRRCLSRARGSAHSSGGRSLSRFHWGRRAWVQLPVSGLMDGLSDFIWAGRTLRWLGPRDCHSWLLYQGLTYRAVILSEQGSQAPRSAIPPSCLSRCHPGTLARLLWLARRLPPTHPGTDTLTNVSWFINSTLGC